MRNLFSVLATPLTKAMHIKETNLEQILSIKRRRHFEMKIIAYFSSLPLITLVNVYVDLVVFTRIAGTS